MRGGRLLVSKIELVGSLPRNQPPPLSVVELTSFALHFHPFSSIVVARVDHSDWLRTSRLLACALTSSWTLELRVRAPLQPCDLAIKIDQLYSSSPRK
eukprot:6182114-Pleurochrysis_carterae.AAC.2